MSTQKIFKRNRKFRRQYDRIFKKNPEAANVFLLLYELTNETGQVTTTERELSLLLAERFDDLSAYQFRGSPRK